MKVRAETGMRVMIVGDHPHFGRTGLLTGKVGTLPWGTKMAEVEFDDERPGERGCFAEAKNLRQIKAAVPIEVIRP